MIQHCLAFLPFFLIYSWFLDSFRNHRESACCLGDAPSSLKLIFYMLFPVLFIIIKTKKEALLFLLMAVLIGYFSRFESHTQYLNAVPQPKWDWSFFAFLPNLYFFAVGI